MMARRALAGILIALLAVPAAASPTSGSPKAALPIGTVSQSNATNISGAGALPGTTVFSGDTIEVGPRGSAWILMNGGRHVRVSSSSRIRMVGQAGGQNRVEMEIFSGAARFGSSETALVIARLADATVRAKGTQPAVGLISVLSLRKALISSEKGELLVSTAHDRRSITLREGEAVEVTLAEVPGKPQTGGSTGASSLTGQQVAILGAVVAAVLIAIGIKLAMDTKDLTLQQKKDAVSPFKFP